MLILRCTENNKLLHPKFLLSTVIFELKCLQIAKGKGIGRSCHLTLPVHPIIHIFTVARDLRDGGSG